MKHNNKDRELKINDDDNNNGQLFMINREQVERIMI